MGPPLQNLSMVISQVACSVNQTMFTNMVWLSVLYRKQGHIYVNKLHAGLHGELYKYMEVSNRNAFMTASH